MTLLHLYQAAALLLAYLIGAIPFGLLIGLARGTDVRTCGSGNIGATNVFRSVGKGWGSLALLLDALKGWLPALLFPLAVATLTETTSDHTLRLLCGCAAVAGHNWPVYLRFKGGKGIATTAGALIGIAPAALGIGLLAWVVTFALARMVSLASLLAAVVIPAAAWWLYADDGIATPMALTVLGLSAIWRHRANISRLVAGTESRIELGKKQSS
jgi:glycerol-3-phosphate acyltransferase PlsY